MSIWIEYLFITAVVVYIIDLSGFTQEWKGWLCKALGGKACKPLKPFDCSLCSVWWVLLIVAHIDGSISPAVCAYIAALSLCADIIGQTIQILKEFIKMALRHLYDITQL